MDYGDGEKYTGDWIKGKQEGKGVYIFKDGARYELSHSRRTYSCGIVFRNRTPEKQMMSCVNSFRETIEMTKGTEKVILIILVVINIQVIGWIKIAKETGCIYLKVKHDTSSIIHKVYILNLSCIQIEIQYTDDVRSKHLQGEWKNGVRHGKGHIDFANGDRYTGDWVKNKYKGKGVYIFSNGARYEIYDS